MSDEVSAIPREPRRAASVFDQPGTPLSLDDLEPLRSAWIWKILLHHNRTGLK